MQGKVWKDIVAMKQHMHNNYAELYIRIHMAGAWQQGYIWGTLAAVKTCLAL